MQMATDANCWRRVWWQRHSAKEMIPENRKLQSIQEIFGRD
jgi:hypothetical protein